LRHAEQRHARRGQIDGQRQAVERAAQRDHLRRVVVAQHELRIDQSAALVADHHRGE